MALSKTSWDEIMKVILFKMSEQGRAGISLDPQAILLTMRDNWDLICDKKACVGYLAEKDLEAKRLAHKEALERSKVLASEIKELEAYQR